MSEDLAERLLSSQNVQNFKPEISQIEIETILNWYREDKLIKAFNTLSSFNVPSTYPDLCDVRGNSAVQELLKKYERELNEIVEKFQETSHLLQEFHTLNGWSLVKKKNEVSTFYRHEEGDLMHSIRLEGVISCPIFDVLAVVYEVDLYPEWWPHIKECFTLKQITNYRKIVYMRGELPWPLYNRDICLYGYGVDMLEESDTIIIAVRSCTSKDAEQFQVELPPLPNFHCRVECKFGGMMMKPLSENSTSVVMLCNVDPKLSGVPYWLLNWITKQVAHVMFEALRVKFSNIKGSIYEKRILEKPEIYQDAKNRIFSHFEKKK